VFNIPIDIHA